MDRGDFRHFFQRMATPPQHKSGEGLSLLSHTKVNKYWSEMDCKMWRSKGHSRCSWRTITSGMSVDIKCWMLLWRPRQLHVAMEIESGQSVWELVMFFWDNSRRKCLRSLFLQILTWCETLLEQSRAVWRHSFGILAFKVLVLILTCTVKKHLGYFSHIFRLPQLHQCDQCDQGMLPNRFSWKSNAVNFAINSQRKVPFFNSHHS